MNTINLNSVERNFKKTLLALFLLGVNFIFSQNYRNEKSYIEDFGKNELYVKESLAEYTKSVVNSNSVDRTDRTLTTIYNKLENINTVLLKTDKGLKGDLTLRDAFINLNAKTLELFKNKTLMLNDYKAMSEKSLDEIDAILKKKENDILGYYHEVSNFEKTKREFGMKYGVKIRSFLKKNILEYNAMENFVFYKISVIDEKYIKLINENNAEEATLCLNYLKLECDNALKAIEEYNDDIADTSLNTTNKNFIEFMKNNNSILHMYFIQYDKLNQDIQKAKNNPSISDEEYNEKVRNYNAVKNIYFTQYKAVQFKKQQMVNKFYVTNSTFLKNNVQFENNYARYTDVD